MPHDKSWFVAGRKIHAKNSMQDYTYTLIYNAGTHIRDGGVDENGKKIRYPTFFPRFSPQKMLELGIFSGKYLGDCIEEFPIQFFTKAKMVPRGAPPDHNLNYFKVKSGLSLTEWRRRGWIPVHPGDNDLHGWFIWWCRYWLGRRDPVSDSIQIKRWNAIKRHYAQVVKHAKGDLTKYRKSRQTLLTWSYDCFV